MFDDINDTGDTLQLGLDYLNGLNPKEIKVAVLHHKITSTLISNFFAQKIIRWCWITYPWAVVEDVLGFVKKIQPQPSTIEQAIERTAQDYGIKVSNM